MRLFLSLALLATGALAQAATEYTKTVKANLTSVIMDANMNLGEGRVTNASVTIDPQARTATLNYLLNNCPVGTLCIAGPMPKKIQLPILSQTLDACGTLVTIAAEDTRPRDGDKKTLTINDNTGFTCQSYRKPDDTDVSYETKYFDRRGGGAVVTVTDMVGDAFKPVIP